MVTAIPDPRSMNRLPSTSSMMPPAARATNTGMVTPTPRDTAATRRFDSSVDTGPGIAVTSLRLCSTVLSSMVLTAVLLTSSPDVRVVGRYRDATDVAAVHQLLGFT